MTTAKEHMAWCKERALALLDRESRWYNPQEAVACMLSDIKKHPDTKKLGDNPLISALALTTLMDLTHEKAEDFIKGFADF